METFIFGHSESGLPIPAHSYGSEGPHILIIGGVHGDEVEGVQAAHGLMDLFDKEGFPFKLKITLVPIFNMDGVLAQRRMNHNMVDLNRNLPTKDWDPEAATERYNPGKAPCSESENKALVEFIENNELKLIFSLHSWKPMINVNGACMPEAEVINKHTGYRIADDIGYPTPGSLGTYTGLERDIPTITYEIEKGLDVESVLKTHPQALFEALKISQERF